MERRVVITGLGAITPIGKNVEETWNEVKNKKCGIDEITLFDTTSFKTKLAAEVKSYNPLDYFDAKQTKRFDRSTQFAIIAAREAVIDSGITKENTDFDRVGTFVTSGIGGMNTIQEQCGVNFEKGNKRVSPMFIPMAIVNMPAGNIAIEFGFKGESMAIVTACASSTHSIGEAYKTIKAGGEDVILAGGSEAAICEIGIAGFENMKALSNSEDKNRASIPFDKERSGFVMGEGAGILVLEELEHALSRGAKIYGELIGFGSTTDAYHITLPCLDGECGAKAITRAIKDANITPEEIDYINAHGTSTHYNDLTETLAIKTALGDASKNVMVSSTKGNIGHLLGAAGAVEAIICMKALEEQIVPPTINYKEKDEECDLDIVPNEPRKSNLDIVMSNSLGFGGHNSSIIMKKLSGEGKKEMDNEKIKQLMEDMGNSKLSSMNIDFPDGTKISMKKGIEQDNTEINSKEITVEKHEEKKIEIDSNKKIEEEKGNVVKSPMVGTFYLKPSPTSDPYVEIGKEVKKGDTLCIIEAMKLMNEIESEYTGKITKILVKDGEPVEYGTELFYIE